MKKFKVLLLFLAVAVSLQSCITTMVVAKVVKERNQEKKADTPQAARLQELARGERKPGRGYIYGKWDSNSGNWYSGNSKKERFKNEVEKLGYVFIDDPDYKCFLPKSEADGFEKEQLFARASGEAVNYVYNKNVKGRDFQSKGSAWLLDRRMVYNSGFINMQDGQKDAFVKVDDIVWTGSVKNGMLDGRGDGYVYIDNNGEKVSYSVSGEFKEGQMVDVIIGRHYEYKKGNYNRDDGSISQVQLYPRSDGYAAYNLTGLERKSFLPSYSGFINQNYSLATHRYESLKLRSDGNYDVRKGDMDFVLNKDMRTVTIPATVTEIPDKCFKNDQSLISITIPKNVKKIGHEAFAGCSNLKEVKFMGPLDILGATSFDGCSSLKTIDLSQVKDPIIGFATFRSCTSLQKITLPNTLDYLGEKSFAGCSSLTTIVFGSKLNKISKYAFQKCTALTSIQIPALTTIEDYAFLDCLKLTTVSIKSYPSIGWGAFKSTKVKNITLNSGSKPVKSSEEKWFQSKPAPKTTSSYAGNYTSSNNSNQKSDSNNSSSSNDEYSCDIHITFSDGDELYKGTITVYFKGFLNTSSKEFTSDNHGNVHVTWSKSYGEEIGTIYVHRNIPHNDAYTKEGLSIKSGGSYNVCIDCK